LRHEPSGIETYGSVSEFPGRRVLRHPDRELGRHGRYVDLDLTRVFVRLAIVWEYKMEAYAREQQ
jgi:hypothetical protein